MKLNEIVLLNESQSPQHAWDLITTLDDHLHDSLKEYPQNQDGSVKNEFNQFKHDKLTSQLEDEIEALRLDHDEIIKEFTHEQILQALEDALQLIKHTQSGTKIADHWSIISVSSKVARWVEEGEHIESMLYKYGLNASHFAQELYSFMDDARGGPARPISPQDHFTAVSKILKFLNKICSSRFINNLNDLDQAFVKATVRDLGLTIRAGS